MDTIDWQEVYQASLRLEEAEKTIKRIRPPKNGWRTAKQINRWLRLMNACEERSGATLILNAAAIAASWIEFEERAFTAELQTADEILAEMAVEEARV